MAKRNAQGSGTIRKKSVIRNGKEYIYWEARYTVGKDPGTGKQIQKCITGKTQAEVRKKLQQVLVAIVEGVYVGLSKLTVSAWLDIWLSDYLGGVKPRTQDSYKTTCNVHIKPSLGALRLTALTPHDIQKFYNNLQKQGLSPKSIKNTHGVFHKALEQAVKLGHIRYNPSSACELPRVEKAELKPLDSEGIKAFLHTVKGHRYENVYLVTLFTGMRQGEVLGLTWDCIDFDNQTITIKQQLQRERSGNGEYHLVSPKNGKIRRITAAPFVFSILDAEKEKQNNNKKIAGAIWNNSSFVFTNEIGNNLSAQTVYLAFKKLVAKTGFPEVRFHDLRHSYAVAALQAGDDIKTVQENLGHHTAAFTLDTYGHVTERMKKESAQRMEGFIKDVLT